MHFILPLAGVATLLVLAGIAFTTVRHTAQVEAAAAAQRTSAATGQPFSNSGRIFLASDQQRQATPAQGFPVGLQSLLKIPDRMRYGDFVWNESGVPTGPVEVRVDLRTQLLSVFRSGHEIGSAVVLYGADEKETPLGSFPILWRGKDHRSSLYDAPMPYTLRLTGDGVAIHGSDVRWGAATHGCIGVPTEFAAHLFQAAKVGNIVTIVRTSPPRA
jgi:lipoprotein-anchoring transpeptidase ErfK/SrfK